MSTALYLLDTHAFFFWTTMARVSEAFIDFFNAENQKGHVFISPISFWELALLAKKKRLGPTQNIKEWKEEAVKKAQLQLLSPTVDDMIASAELPPHHRDPFDRLLIAQAQNARATLVTQDAHIARYAVETTWIA